METDSVHTVRISPSNRLRPVTSGDVSVGERTLVTTPARWIKAYQRQLVGLDLLAAALAVVFGYLLRFGPEPSWAQPYAGLRPGVPVHLGGGDRDEPRL